MIAQTIQLALAPVFMLVAIGNIMNILSQRLGRVVDRSRMLQGRHMETEGGEHDEIVREIRAIDLRIALISKAIQWLVFSGLCVGVVVVLLFVEEFAEIDLQVAVAFVFLLAIALLMSALTLFMRETRQAAASLRIAKSYLELERKL